MNDLENLESDVIYKSLVINDIVFKNVKVFILDNKIEVVDNWSGLVVAIILKDDVKMINNL